VTRGIVFRFVATFLAVTFAVFVVNVIEAGATDRPRVKVETVLSGLNNPCGIAVQPGTGHLFVSDSGAGRIVRFDPAKPAEPVEVITGLPRGTYGKGPVYDIGPLGLAFLNQNQRTLVMGGGGLPDGEELVRVYTLPEDGSPVSAGAAATLGPLAEGADTKTGEGNFYGLAAADRDTIYVTSNGDDTKGWLLIATFKDRKPVSLKPYIATKAATNVNAPVGIAMHRDGYIVVSQMGETGPERDSLLTMYHPVTKEVLLNLETGLYDVAALAYGPDSELYAADFAWADGSKGGIYRLDLKMKDGRQTIAPELVARLDRPAAMAFGRDRALYVAVFGTPERRTDKPAGGVVKITCEKSE